MVYNQRILSVIVIVQVQHGGAEVVQEEAPGPFVAWVKRITMMGSVPWSHSDRTGNPDHQNPAERVKDTLSEL